MFERLKILFNRLQFGFLSYSSFVICIVSGIILAFAFDVSKPDGSISLIIIINKPALFIRSLHYWSAQIFLVTCIFHVIDHFLKKTERTISASSWLRLTLVIPVIIYLMFSGFLLRGDYDAKQALSIISSLLKSIPFIGFYLSYLFLGNSGNYQFIYLHHIVTTTIIVWLITIDHAKLILPSAKSIVKVLPLIILLSSLLIPYISLNNSIVPKGPWYFAGMQEIFHWLESPVLVIYILLVLLFAFFFISNISDRYANKFKLIFIIFLITYSGISVFALFFRGDGWKFTLPWKEDTNSSGFISFRQLKSPDTLFTYNNIPVIQGKIESCYFCHSGMEGLSKSHDISSIGCYYCHLGEPLSLSKDISHSGMTLTPGNLNIVNMTCATTGCHANISSRIDKSLMTTMSGVAAVDKYVFNEAKNPDGLYIIDKIGFSDADKHLRGLCASCHLSSNKQHPAPVDELSRGGGCSACHLNYEKNSLDELVLLQKKKYINPKAHPEININVTNKNCFGCHSRSGRIATNYEGWHETHFSEKDYSALDKSKYRLLQDGRIFEKQPDDAHHKAGMQCIDCHNSYEIMGDGKNYIHKENAVKIKCQDCHNPNPRWTTYSQIDQESQKILFLRNSIDRNRKFIASQNGSIPYLNTYTNYYSTWLIPKSGDRELSIKPPSQFCGNNINGHSRLDCKSCHTNWAPQCIGCHTQYDPMANGWDNLLKKETKGAWLEKDRDFYAEYPALGVITENGAGKEKISTFVPGMVLTIQNGNNRIFKRLYAPAFSHTITRNATTCKTCHNNPAALGYGRGELKLNLKNSRSFWSFIPKYELNKNDNLPEDSWIGFLTGRIKDQSTRTNTRPFSVEEQKKILNIGACFACHKENNKKVLFILSDFKNRRKFLPKSCVLPF